MTRIRLLLTGNYMAHTNTLSGLQEEFIRILEDGFKIEGAEAIVGRIVALIFLSPAPLTQEQIAEKTGYSRAQISRHLKRLVQVGLLTNRSKPGTKIQLYEGKGYVNNFEELLRDRQHFLSEQVKIMDNLKQKWQLLPEEIKKSVEGKKFNEVISSYSKITHLTLDIIQDYLQHFDLRMKELEKLS
ncbi:MAG: MarR family transcriptional regulator [Promethearchaeota archaeon]